MVKSKNVLNQKQFRGEYKPVQPSDEFDRTYRREPNPPPSPKSDRNRMGVQIGSQVQARPGMVGKQDFKRKPKGRK